MTLPTYDVKTWHSLEFTDVENVTLKKWLELVLGLVHPKLAVQVLASGLELEHYTSLLPDDPLQRTKEELAKQSDLLATFNHFLDKAEHPPFVFRAPGDMTPAIQEEPTDPPSLPNPPEKPAQDQSTGVILDEANPERRGP